MKKTISERQKYNKVILEDLKRQDFFEKFVPEDTAEDMYDIIEEKILGYPELRFGQIFCNDLYPDYRERTEDSLNQMFDMLTYGCKCDFFYEEPVDTVKRLRIEI